MAILQGNAKSVADGGFYPTTIDQSLRFNDNDSAYLSRTPSTAGNRKTWTWSGWVKRGNLGAAEEYIWHANNSSTTDNDMFGFNTDFIRFRIKNSNTVVAELKTNAVYRDVAAWYHIVILWDSTQATASDRCKLYVNGEQVTSFSTATYPAQNTDTSSFNNTVLHTIGDSYFAGVHGTYFDGYLAEVHFTDGTAYTADDFGEFKNGVWVAKTPSVTYGTNGFYLPFNSDYAVEGFNAVTWTGNGTNNYIGGVGFSPDLVWCKSRSTATWHELHDTVRGAAGRLYSNDTSAESTIANGFVDFANDGFLLDGTGSGGEVNYSGRTYVAWCWDAGTGSPVSNTDGSITSTVKANTAQGFSIVSYTGTGAAATVGHGLSQAPDLVIYKRRDSTSDWLVLTTAIDGSVDYAMLNQTAMFGNATQLAPTATVINLDGPQPSSNATASSTHVAYAFHSVSGYSSIGSYSGTGAAGNAVTCGFKPAFVIVKQTNGVSQWLMQDNMRQYDLYANLSNAEATNDFINFTDTGFEFTGSGYNTSSDSFIYMAFADTREAGFFLDQSGNNNDWTANVLTESDVSLDSPTNNFATLNPLNTGFGAVSLSEGNTKTGNATATWGNIAISSGKWYAEVLIQGTGSVGIDSRFIDGSTYYLYYNTGQKNSVATGLVAYAATYTTNDIIGIAFDLDAGSVTFYKNGVSQGVAFTGITANTYTVLVNALSTLNFGQDSSFAGTKTPQGYTDANGIGDFYYAPPTGYLALCTANLPEPAISPADGASPTDYMNTVLYSGNTGNQVDVSGVGFQPDLLWLKNRTTATGGNHILHDTIRQEFSLSSDLTNAEIDQTGNFVSFNADGFSVAGATAQYNNTGNNYVAWNWLAGGTGVSNTDGTITSTVSANTTSGFSVITYTGNGTNGSTFGHGLNETPDFFIIKNRSAATDWLAGYFPTASNCGLMWFNKTDSGAVSAWNSADATTISIDFDMSNVQNTSGHNYVCYAFHSVEGFSKCGSYVGNGSSDGVFVHCGFRPSFLLVKRTDSAASWFMFDDARDTYNQQYKTLLPNSSAAEDASSADEHDFLSNGFKWRSTGSGVNASGGTYIFIAFAENPFKYTTAR